MTMSSSFNEDGFYETIFDLLSRTRDGAWYDFAMKLLECIINLERKVALIRRINEVRRHEGWSLLNE